GWFEKVRHGSKTLRTAEYLARRLRAIVVIVNVGQRAAFRCSPFALRPGAFLAFNDFLVTPLAASSCGALRFELFARCGTQEKERRAKSEKRCLPQSGYNRANASTAYRRGVRCGPGLLGRLSHHVAHVPDLRPDVYWARARLSPAGANLRRRAQRSLHLAHDGSAGAPRREGHILSHWTICSAEAGDCACAGRCWSCHWQPYLEPSQPHFRTGD